MAKLGRVGVMLRGSAGLVTVATLLSNVTAKALEPPAWTEMPPLPEGLAGFAGWPDTDGLCIAGGTMWRDGLKIWSDEVWVLDEPAGRWRRVGSLPAPRAHAGYVVENDCVWMVGGHNAGESRSDLLRLCARGRVEVRGHLDAPWHFAHGTSVNGRAHFVARQAVAGGWTGIFAEVMLETGLVLPREPLPNLAWVLPAVCSAAGRVTVAGGAVRSETSGALANQSAVFVFDVATGAWTEVGHLPEPVRGPAAAGLDDRHVYIAGGFGNHGCVRAGTLLNAASGEIAPAPPLPLPLMLPELVRMGEALYCLGGEDAPRSRSRRVFRVPIRDLLRQPPPAPRL